MEKTLDELLFEKLRETTRFRHHDPHMPEGMRGRDEFPGKGEGRPCPPQGPEKGMHPHPKKRHGIHHLHRERILGIILETNEKGMSQKEILEQMRIHPSSLSELIDKLEADRYVERVVNPEDKRSTLIVLTEKGKARAWEVKDEHRERCARIFAALSDEEKKQLFALLAKLEPGKTD